LYITGKFWGMQCSVDNLYCMSALGRCFSGYLVYLVSIVEVRFVQCSGVVLVARILYMKLVILDSVRMMNKCDQLCHHTAST